MAIKSPYNILIRIINGMSIQSIVELHSNLDFPLDTSIILYHQKFSWFQTKDTKFQAIIPTFKIYWDTSVWYVDTGLWLPFVFVWGGKWLFKLLLKEYVINNCFYFSYESGILENPKVSSNYHMFALFSRKRLIAML